jgi:hypothetical protein
MVAETMGFEPTRPFRAYSLSRGIIYSAAPCKL